MAVVALRMWAGKKVGQGEGKRSKVYASGTVGANVEKRQLSYKINLWRVVAVLFTYL